MFKSNQCAFCGKRFKAGVEHGDYCAVCAPHAHKPHVVRQRVLPAIKVEVEPPPGGWVAGSRVIHAIGGYLFVVSVYNGAFLTMIAKRRQ